MRGSDGVMPLLIHQMRPTVFVGASRVQEHLMEGRARFFQFGLRLRRGQASVQNTLNLFLKSFDADVECLHHYADGEGLVKCRPVDGHIAEVVQPLAHVHSAQGVLQHSLVFVGAVRVVRGNALDNAWWPLCGAVFFSALRLCFSRRRRMRCSAILAESGALESVSQVCVVC